MIADVNGLKIAYREQGQGPRVLLLLHGFPLNSKMWQPQLDGLADVARVLAPDMRGFGESEAIPGPYPMDTLADGLAGLLDTLGINEPVIVCGLSMGGYVTMAFQRRHPTRLNGMILAATRADADSEEMKQTRTAMIEAAREQGVQAVIERMLPKIMAPQTYERRPELVEQVRAIMEQTTLEGATGALEGMRERPNSMDVLKTVDCPALVLYGADDQIMPRSAAEAMRNALPQGKLEVIGEAGHLLNMEQPEAFNNAVRHYLKTLEGPK
jgi:3-oxoadipate enol-lactonase